MVLSQCTEFVCTGIVGAERCKLGPINWEQADTGPMTQPLCAGGTLKKPGFTAIMPWAAPALKPLPDLAVNERLTLKDVSLPQVLPASAHACFGAWPAAPWPQAATRRPRHHICTVSPLPTGNDIARCAEGCISNAAPASLKV